MIVENKVVPNEILKQENPALAGRIAETLADPAVDHLSDDDNQFLKFHGAYQQDDRDLRKTGKKYIFMVRGRLPGGIVSADQYLAFGDLSDHYADGTLRITTRQGFQFHGIVKTGLAKVIQGINRSLATTLAACGDVTRNVMAPPTPAMNPLGERVLDDAKRLSALLLPQTPAYHEIWVDGKDVSLERPDFVDPLYGKTYLPRKFKVAFVIPPLNDIDIFTNCLGFVAIGEGAQLHGYNLLAGGGMGMSHGNAQTFPRMADVIGFIEPHAVDEAAKAVLTLFRDHGDRTNRKHARLKYVLEDRGVEWFRQEFESRAGFALSPARPFTFTRQGDLFGWYQQSNGQNALGLYVESGRIRDNGALRLKSGLRAVVEQVRPEVRLTPSQNLILANIAPGRRQLTTELLAEHGIHVEAQANRLRRASMSCPALPTCGLALAESERFFPDAVSLLEGLMDEAGIGGEEIIFRLTGCPNGCARPYMAELALVGRAPNRYQLFVGGNEPSTRIARLYKGNVKVEELAGTLRPLLARYVAERENGERFGDFCARSIWPEIPAE